MRYCHVHFADEQLRMGETTYLVRNGILSGFRDPFQFSNRSSGTNGVPDTISTKNAGPLGQESAEVNKRSTRDNGYSTVWAKMPVQYWGAGSHPELLRSSASWKGVSIHTISYVLITVVVVLAGGRTPFPVHYKWKTGTG